MTDRLLTLLRQMLWRPNKIIWFVVTGLAFYFIFAVSAYRGRHNVYYVESWLDVFLWR